MSTFTARLTDDWIPLPDGAVRWAEGDALTIEVVDDHTLIVTRTPPTPRPEPQARGTRAPYHPR